MKKLILWFLVAAGIGSVGVWLAVPRSTSVLRVNSENARLSQAIEQARAGLPKFKERLAVRAPGERYAVRCRFTTDNGPEYLWVKNPVFTAGQVMGLLDQPPMALSNKKRGDLVTLPESEVVDWLIGLPDGSREGGFTDQALMR